MLDDFARALLDKEYYIWGAGKQGRRLLDQLDGKINILGFVDSDVNKQGTLFHGHCIHAFEQIKDISGLKILVTGIYTAEIMENLKNAGLQENADYCDWKKFLSVYYWYKHKKLFMYRGNISITQKCTLNCEHCNMLMPFHEKPKHYSIQDLKEWIDNYFAYVDYAAVFDILGGEPLLHPDVGELTSYLGEKWGGRIGEIQFFTNGTITPADNLLNILKQYDVEMVISDYRNGLPKVGQMVDRFVGALKQKGIRYSLKYFENWIDFGYPYARHNSVEAMKEIFKNCACAVSGIYNNRLYFCNVQVGAEMLGAHNGNEHDWIDLLPFSEDKKLRFFEFDSGVHPLGYVSFCSRCDGIGRLNNNTVPVASQLPRKKIQETGA